MKNSEIMTKAEIEKKLKELHEKMRQIRFTHIGARAKNVKEESLFRREIARLETMLNSNK